MSRKSKCLVVVGIVYLSSDPISPSILSGVMGTKIALTVRSYFLSVTQKPW